MSCVTYIYLLYCPICPSALWRWGQGQSFSTPACPFCESYAMYDMIESLPYCITAAIAKNIRVLNVHGDFTKRFWEIGRWYCNCITLLPRYLNFWFLCFPFLRRKGFSCVACELIWKFCLCAWILWWICGRWNILNWDFFASRGGCLAGVLAFSLS